jgi:hypothetical protein
VEKGLIWAILALGVWQLVRPAPVAGAPKVLRRYGRAAKIEFAFGEDGRLTAGRRVEGMLSQVIWRLNRAWGCFVTFAVLTVVLMAQGPPLSQSDLKSVVVALVVCASVLGPYVILREFLQPVAGPGPAPLRRAVQVEDYVTPVRRVITWLGAASMLAIPVAAVLLARTSAYDGTKFYWEGLIGLPLTVAMVVLASEIETRGTRDSIGDPALVYLWDALRHATLRLTGLFGLAGAGVAWQMASQGLVGVALVGPSPPGWVSTATALADAWSTFLMVSAFVMLFGSARRRRARLWPDLQPNENVPWGASPEPLSRT